MEILIGEDFKITSDKMNVIVNRKVMKMDKPGKEGKPTGEFSWKETSFHPTFERAANKVLDERINASDAASLAEVVRVVERHRKDIETLINGVEHVFGKGE